MNSCVLMAKIIRKPQLRYIQEGDLAVTDMMVEFTSNSTSSPPYNLKAVAWGNLAKDIEQQYNEVDQVIVTGRLKMDLLERQGYKEKVAELTVSHIYPLANNNVATDNVVNLNNYQMDGNNFELDEQEVPAGDMNYDDMPF